MEKNVLSFIRRKDYKDIGPLGGEGITSENFERASFLARSRS